MADTADLDELARKYLDLWQEHLNAIAADGETMDVLARTVALMNSGAAAFATAANGISEDDNSSSGSGSTAAASTDRPKTADVTSGNANPDMDECLKRLAVLEQRVADLEDVKTEKPKKQKPVASKR